MRTKLQQGVLFFISFLLLLIVFALPLFAQESDSTTSAEPVIDYSLPYPGILPDNPLYIFKAMRDRFVSFLISDPKEKATFDLLLADKRLAAAFALSKETKVNGPLVVQTVSKGENYFFEAVGQAVVAQKQGEEINGLLGQLKDANAKHLQLITGMGNSVSKKDSEQLNRELQRVQELQKQVAKLRPR